MYLEIDHSEPKKMGGDAEDQKYPRNTAHLSPTCGGVLWAYVLGAFFIVMYFGLVQGPLFISLGDKTSNLVQKEPARSHPLRISAVNDASPLPFPAKAFWHIGNPGNNPVWHLVVREQLSRLHTSGLLDSMNVSVTYVAESATEMPTFLDERVEVEYGGLPSRHEWVTLTKLTTYCSDNPQGRVIYFHNKGISYQLTDQKFWSAYDWRRLLEYFVMDCHRSVLLNDLSDESPYVAAGALYDIAVWLCDKLHFSGNMWAAKCEYVNKLPRVETYDKEPWQYRYLAEMWIGEGPEFETKHKNCWNHWDTECTLDTYACAIPEERYLGLKQCGRPPPPKGVKIVDHFGI